MDTHLLKRLVILAIFILVLFGGVFGWRAFVAAKTESAIAHAPPQRVTVSVAQAKVVNWRSELEATASLKAIQGTLLTPQLAGMVTGINFQSGSTVKEGQLLIQLNDANQKAQLGNDEAALALAKTEFEQQRSLYREHNTSALALQRADTAYIQAQAAVSSDRATIAKLQIRAPFSGHLGLRQVSLGQYVDTTTPVVNLQQWNPIYADFQLPQQQVSRIALGQKVTLAVPGMPNRDFSGQVSAIGAQIQTGTRNVNVRATLSNPDSALRPGMYGQVTLLTGATRRVLAVPDSAISYNTYGSYVYVVEQGKGGLVANERNVTTGEARKTLTIVTRGLKPGERVVTAGQVKLHPGTLVTVAPVHSRKAAAAGTGL